MSQRSPDAAAASPTLSQRCAGQCSSAVLRRAVTTTPLAMPTPTPSEPRATKLMPKSRWSERGRAGGAGACVGAGVERGRSIGAPGSSVMSSSSPSETFKTWRAGSCPSHSSTSSRRRDPPAAASRGSRCQAPYRCVGRARRAAPFRRDAAVGAAGAPPSNRIWRCTKLARSSPGRSSAAASLKCSHADATLPWRASHVAQFIRVPAPGSRRWLSAKLAQASSRSPR